MLQKGHSGTKKNVDLVDASPLKTAHLKRILFSLIFLIYIHCLWIRAMSGTSLLPSLLVSLVLPSHFCRSVVQAEQ